jgi:uncharacterized protein involved in outer membrane biogenesis
LFALLALVLIGAGAALALRHFTRPQALTTLLIDQTRSALGAKLSLDGTAHFDFVPKLHLVLPHPTLKAIGASTPFLEAESLNVVVPWHTLWVDRYDIEQIDLAKPTLDLDRFSAWFNARPPSGAPADVRFSLHVVSGTIISAGKAVAQGLKMDFASTGDLAAWLAKLAKVTSSTALVPPLRGSAAAAALQIGSTHLDDVRIEIRDDDANHPAAAAGP